MRPTARHLPGVSRPLPVEEGEMDRGGVAAQRGSRPVLASNLTGRPHGSRLGLTADLAESASAVVQAS